MTSGNNEPRHVQGAGGRMKSAVAAAPKVAQATDNAQPEVEEILRDYWQAAKACYQRGDYVDYASADWCALPIEDPRKMAGLVAFAENWRKYHLDIADELNDALKPHPPIWQRPTLAELNQAHDDMLARNRRSTRKEAA